MITTRHLTVALLLLVGCNRADHPQTFEVTGDVQLDGRPLPSGTVVFTSETGRASKGVIGSSGAFKLGTYAEDDGALAGRYQVMIVAPDTKAMEGKAVDLERKAPSLVPMRYTSTTTSGLEFEVTPAGPNVAHFLLTSTPAP